jgi:hypothetical protein
MKLFTSTIDRHLWKIPLITACVGILLFCQSADSGKSRTAENSTTTATAQAPAEKAAAASDTAVTKATVTDARKLVVYYFHTTFRCHSCNLIESLTKQAVEAGFGEQVKTGRVEMKVINIETPGNEHFAEDYKLYTKSVILSDLKNGKEATWKNLDKVWTLLRDQGAFIDYIQKEIKTNLQG